MSQQEFDTLKKLLATSRKEFDTLKEQLARSKQETAAVKMEVDSWQNSTILILKQYLIENPSKLIWNVYMFESCNWQTMHWSKCVVLIHLCRSA